MDITQATVIIRTVIILRCQVLYTFPADYCSVTIKQFLTVCCIMFLECLLYRSKDMQTSWSMFQCCHE